MRLHKLLRLSSIALMSLTLSIALFFCLQSNPTTAAQKSSILAFVALQREGSEVRSSLFTINANGADRRELTPKIEVSSTFVWSPDRTKIAFFSGTYPQQQVYTINADGTNLKNLTDNPQHQVYNVKLFWSPDSSRIAYYQGKAGDLSGEKQDIYAIDINRGTAQNLTQKPSNYDAVSWSPDGKLIAFAAGEFNNQKLYTINSEGSQLTQLASRLELSGISELSWSSDSKKIAFSFHEIQDNKSNLYAINRDGSRLTKLTNDKDLNASSPVWQPQ